MVFEVRAEDKELTAYQRRFSMKEILTRLNAGGERALGDVTVELYSLATVYVSLSSSVEADTSHHHVGCRMEHWIVGTPSIIK